METRQAVIEQWERSEPNNQSIALIQHTAKIVGGKLAVLSGEAFSREPEEINRVLSLAMARQMQGATFADLSYADGIVDFFNWLSGDDSALALS